jgi:hypothetical protein
MKLNEFLTRNSDGEQVLDKAKFRKFASEVSAKVANRTEEDLTKAVANVQKLVSSGLDGVSQLSAIEADYEVLNIFRDSIALDMVEMRPLPLGTIPVYRTKVLDKVSVQVGSTAGMGSMNYWATTQAGVQVYPFVIGTEKIMIPNLNNIYDIEKLQLRRDGLARLDHFLEMAINNAVINTIFANSSSVSVITDDPATTIVNYATAGGSFSGKTVYSLDPGVQTAAVPTVNYYDLHGEGGLTKTVFQTVQNHAITIDRQFMKMYIPTAAVSGHQPVWASLQNMATPVALITAGLTQANAFDPAKAIPEEMWSKFQNDDWRGAVVIDWFGLKVSVERQNWLPAGYAVLFSTIPSAIMWDRLSMEAGAPMDGTLEVPVDGFYNYRSKARQIALARPDFCLRNFLLLKIDQ